MQGASARGHLLYQTNLQTAIIPLYVFMLFFLHNDLYGAGYMRVKQMQSRHQ